MPHTMAEKLEMMRYLTLSELRDRYREVFDGAEAPDLPKKMLQGRVAWRMQEQELGGLSPLAKEKLREIQSTPEFRPERPELDPPLLERGILRDRRLPPPGSIIKRHYKGRLLEVKVLEKGFEYLGRRWRSLTSITEEVTNAHWNGFDFFGL